MQNSALGAVLATAHFPAHPLAAVPCAISGGALQLLGCWVHEAVSVGPCTARGF